MRRQSGFTLVELLVVIGMIAVVAAISIPNIIGMMPDYRLRSAAHDLFSNFQKAKLEAVKRNINTAVVFAGTGYTVFVDSSTAPANFQIDGGEEVVVAVGWSGYKDVSVVFPGNVLFTNNAGGNPCIAFRPDGIPVDSGGASASGNIQLDNTNGKSTKVFVTASGNIRIE